MKARVLVSAGIPHGQRASAYAPFSAEAITDAVVWVSRVLLRRGAHLVVGAQPAISPVLLRIAPEAPEGWSVEVFQSERYRSRVPKETLALQRAGHGRIRWVQADEAEPERVSLSRMRAAMLEAPLDAGVFIGGMGGVEEEFSLFRRRHSRAPAFVFGGPGGAARRLAYEAGAGVQSWAGGEYPRYAVQIADLLGLSAPGSEPAP